MNNKNENNDETFTIFNSFVVPDTHIQLSHPAISQLKQTIKINDSSNSIIQYIPSESINNSLFAIPNENSSSILRKTISRQEIESLPSKSLSIPPIISYLPITDWTYLNNDNFISIETSFTQHSSSIKTNSYNILTESVSKCNLNQVHIKPHLNYNISPLSTIEYLIEQTFTSSNMIVNTQHQMISHLLKIEPHVQKWRHIRRDGNCFYRAVIFAFLENIVLTNNLYLLKEFALGFHKKINKNNPSIQNKQYIINIINTLNVGITSELFVLLIEHLEQDKTMLCYETLIKAFCFCPPFDIAVIFYFKFLLYEYIKENEGKMYRSDFMVNIGNLLPLEYQGDNGIFDYEQYYEKQLLPMGVDVEKIVIYVTPFVLKCDLKVVMYDAEITTDDVIYIKDFVCGLKDKMRIEVLFRKVHYDIIYNKEYFDKYQNILSTYTNLNENVKVLDSYTVERIHEMLKNDKNVDLYSALVQINEEKYKKDKFNNNINNNEIKGCNLCKSKITNSIGIPLCEKCIENELKHALPLLYRNYLILLYDEYSKNSNINFSLSFESFFSKQTIILYNQNQDIQQLTTLTKYSFNEYIENVKQKICLYCLKEITNYNGIKLSCSCIFCEMKCFLNFYKYFLIEDYNRKFTQNLKQPIFTHCLCGYKYSISDYKNIFSTLDNSTMKDNLKHIIRDLWMNTCSNCLSFINDHNYMIFEFKSKTLSSFDMKNAKHALCNKCEKLFKKEDHHIECKICNEKHEMQKKKQHNLKY